METLLGLLLILIPAILCVGISYEVGSWLSDTREQRRYRRQIMRGGR